jgi:hypothetical protein
MGPQGPQGVPGATGAGGTTLTQIVSENSAALDDGTNYVHLQVSCPPDERVTGGGFYVQQYEGPSGNIVPVFNIYESRPFTTGGGTDMWLVSGTNKDAAARAAGILTAYAMCTNKTP